MKKYTIKDMNAIALKRDGICLSDYYVNSTTKLRWKCREGHEWESAPANILGGSWCPTCALNELGNSRKNTIENMRELARNRGGKCLSPNYVNSRTKLLWRCVKGHEWEATPGNVKNNNSWCPYCAGQHKTIEDMRIMAKSNVGECLSPKFIDMKTKLKWKCQEGHVWEASPSSVNTGHWCPYCVGMYKSLKDIKELAVSRGGECLSTTYKSVDEKLHWRCSEGHEWEARLANVQRGSWCPICSQGVSERICRETFQRIFKKDFPNRRPKWLINPETGKRLELDGYCEELNLAFEYQGAQHYREVSRYSSSQNLQSRIMIDKLKRKVCKDNNVILLEIPYFISYEKMLKFILQLCKKKGVEVPEPDLEIFNYKEFDVYSPKKLEYIQNMAKEKGGECLSNSYINNKTKLLWKCANGHEWEATPDSIQAGHWCPYCSKKAKHTLKEMQEIAKSYGGLCLSHDYINTKTKLKWKCNKGHQWEAPPSNILVGSWCPKCSIVKVADSKRGTIKEVQRLAKIKGGDCLSKTYVNSQTKLKWRCDEGHVWEATPGSIKGGSWCPICGYKKVGDSLRSTIDDLLETAEGKGGKCLSDQYEGKDIKLRWMCNKGHKWEATPGSVRGGKWCPICAGNKKLTIEDIQEFAESRDGECLSKEYVNKSTKLCWRCAKGHIWEATPGSVRNRGSWCPICAREKRITNK